MKLREELASLTREIEEATLPQVQQTLERAIADLKKLNFAQRALKVGDKAPNFSLPDAQGMPVRLSTLLLKGPLLLTFYRGGWCPYCNLTLRAFQNVMPDIQMMGAQMVAISPEKPDNSLLTMHKNQLDYVVLSDISSEAARRFGVSFVLPVYLKRLYRTFGLNLEKYNNAKNVGLPVPATFLIDTNGIVQFAFADEDYTQRADIDEILKTLATLKQEECIFY